MLSRIRVQMLVIIIVVLIVMIIISVVIVVAVTFGDAMNANVAVQCGSRRKTLQSTVSKCKRISFTGSY